MRRISLALMCACAIVTGCSGGRQDSTPAAAAVQPAARSALAANTPDATHLMDWAEVHYPQFFPTHQTDQSGYGYTYRYYPDTGNYLGVSGNDVAVLGPLTGGAIQNVGTLSGFACAVDPVACGLPDVVAQPQSTAVAPGANATFELALSPVSSAAVQWQYSTDGGHVFVDIPGASATSFLFSSALADDGKWIRATVSNAQGAVTTRPARLTVTAPTVLTACAEITTPGLYVLGADLKATPNSVSCLNVHDTADVHLDCAGHSVTQSANLDASTSWAAAERFNTVRGFSVRNCRFDDDRPTFYYVENGSISHNTFANNGSQTMVLQLDAATRVQFYANKVVGTVAQLQSYQSTISGNTMTATPGLDTYALVSSFASHGTLIASNSMDGAFTGGAWHLAADDAVALLEDNEPTVQDNAIANVYDTGIEWTGLLNAAKIRRNTIANTGYSGMGGWYWASALNSEFIDNDVSGVPTMFFMQHSNFLRASDTGVYFMNNRFEGNVLHATDAGQMSVVVRVYDYLSYNFSFVPTNPGDRAATQADFHLSGNVFANNSFGWVAIGPLFGYGSGTAVLGEIIDGGGNVCRRYLGVPAPLVCH